MRPSARALFLSLSSLPATAAPAMAQSCNPTSIVQGALEATQQASSMSFAQRHQFLHDYNTQAVAGTAHPILCRMALAGLEEKALHSNGLQIAIMELKTGVLFSRNPDVAAEAAKCCPASSGPAFN